MLEEKALSTIKRLNMISFNDKILVGVSGGPDSISLLNFLLSLKEKYHLTIYVAHLNHLLRGRDSDKDAEFVKKIADELNLTCQIENCDIYKYSKSHSLTIEEAARDSRYEFFNRTTKTFKANKIALGHHSDDQVETVLMRIIRGCGVDGLLGIPPVRGNIIRPLIECSRKDIEKYCQKYKLKYRNDLTNATPVYFRNKVRLELLPFLSENYNKNIKNNLLRFRTIVSDVAMYLQEETNAAFNKVVGKKCVGQVTIDLERLRVLSLVLQRRIIRKSIKIVKGNLYSINFKHIKQIISLIDRQTGEKWLNLPNGVLIKRDYNKLIISTNELENKKEESSAHNWEYGLSISGTERIESLNMLIKSRIVDSREISFSNIFRKNKSDSKLVECLDYDKLKFPIKIRNRRIGDSFFPLNMDGLKRIKKYLIDMKIPKNQRDSIPLLVDSGGNIIWVVGFRLDDRVKIDKTTKRILCIKILFK